MCAFIISRRALSLWIPSSNQIKILPPLVCYIFDNLGKMGFFCRRFAVLMMQWRKNVETFSVRLATHDGNFCCILMCNFWKESHFSYVDILHAFVAFKFFTTSSMLHDFMVQLTTDCKNLSFGFSLAHNERQKPVDTFDDQCDTSTINHKIESRQN